ncbi:MAG: flagellar hook-associated protein FlgK [Planctomycetota bacterium]|nr:flagellar hook-associated protein FlgK [Planctomycetota bacterium]
MSNYTIGLSGLQVAQRALDLVGTNIANASTPGYHKQELDVATLSMGGVGNSIGAGAVVTGVERVVDKLLESQLINQQSNLSAQEQKLSMLETIESSLGKIGSGNDLGTAIDGFFKALNQLPSQPDSRPLQEQVIWAADSLASQFRNLSNFLAETRKQLLVQAQTVVEQINGLSGEVAQANVEIGRSERVGSTSNVVQDNRDHAINSLSELVGTEVLDDVNNAGVRNVSIGGTLLVLDGTSVTLKAGTTTDGQLGIAAQDSQNWTTSMAGGKLGAILELANTILPDITGRLNALASQVISGINRVHVQGVGGSGSFSDLSGVTVSEGTIDTWNAGVTAGSFYLRVTNQATGEITRQKIDVDPAVDTIGTVNAKIDALDHISSSVVNSALHLQADDNYTFDFIPALASEPAGSTFTGTAAPTVGGIYTGADNEVYTCTVAGTGTVGVTDGLSVEVRNQAGTLVKTVNVGQGYASGDRLDIGQGITVSLSTGTLTGGEAFTIQAMANTDSSGFLAAAGLNTFFQGSDASTIQVRQEIMDEPSLLATSIGPMMTDGANVARLAAVGDTTSAALDGATPAMFFQQLVTRTGQSVATTDALQKSFNDILQQITQQREAISGVDVNVEAANLLVFERMYQAISKYISTQDKALSYLMEMT